jgi:polyhydroxybutyrate depolymerase
MKFLQLLCVICTGFSGVSAYGAAQPASNYEYELTDQGAARSYIAHIPPAAGALPLIVNLHGGGGNAHHQQDNSGMDELADREGFIVIYPNGSGRLKNRLLTWNAGTCCGPSARESHDDAGFILRVLDDITKRAPVDQKRVYVTGFSNGAMMALRLGAQFPGRFAALAAVSGGFVFNEAPKAALPLLYIHSVGDPRALYQGGLGPPFPLSGERVMHPSADETLKRWARANACSGTPLVLQSKELAEGRNLHTAQLISWPNCAAPLLHWRLTGAGHVWPGTQREAVPALSGEKTAIIDANAEIWNFFKQHALP